MKKNLHTLVVMLFVLVVLPLQAQTYTFSNAGASGSYGPTQSQVNAAYTGTTLEGQVTINTQGIQEWTVPANGEYRIQVIGATGGNQNEPIVSVGHPANISGDFTLTAGETLKIIVGQHGHLGSTRPGWGGGGGSFVAQADNTPLAVAGGCGSGHTSLTNEGLTVQNANTGTSGKNGSGGTGTWPDGYGATGGQGGDGAGLLGNGTVGNNGVFDPPPGITVHTIPQAFVNYGAGDEVGGGFGGGGGVTTTYGGGGGGYSGGQGGANFPFFGGGGASFNSGVNQINILSSNDEYTMSHGQVIITLLNAPPVITCPGDITVSNDPGSCGAVINYIVTATDTEDGVLIPIQTAGLAPGSVFPVGITTNIFEITDSDSNTVSCSFTVTVNDTEAPAITCPGDITQNNDLGICGAVVTYTISATDNCSGGATTEYIQNGGFETGDFSGWSVVDSGSGSYYLNDGTYTPISGAGALAPISGNFDVVTDQSGPGLHLLSQPFTVPSDVQSAIVSWNDRIRNNAGVFSDPNQEFRVDLVDASMNVIQEVYSTNPGDPSTQIGPNFRQYDLTALLQTLSGQVVSLRFSEQDDLGNFNLTLDDISFVIENINITQTAGLPSGSVFPLGTTTNTFQATDANGNITSCSFDVTVNDTEAPTAVCQNITVQLDANGDAIVLPEDVDGGSTDNCGVASLQFTEQFTAFAEVAEGQNLTITLPAGRVVTSVDFASYGTPNGSNGTYTIGACHATNSQTIVEGYALGNNSFTIPATNAVFGDPCGGTVKRLYVAVSARVENSSLSFSCSEVGNNNVTLLVTDDNGNTSTCTAIVTVEDNVAPVANCAAPFTIQLDANGAASISVADIDNGSTDACGIASTSIDITNFTCADVGPNTVTLTVTDVNGNTSTCTTTVTVEDNVAPVANCAAPFTIQLDANGAASIVVADIENGSTDACGIASTSIDITNFSCADVGPNPVTLTVTDVNGNTSTCTTTVTVEDNVAPVANCAAPFTIQLDANGVASITVADIENGSTDACGIASTTIDVTDFDCSDVGPNTVTLTVTDVNGNTSTCTTIVTVEDSLAPIIACPADILANTDPGACFATASFAMPIAFDNCGIDTVVQTAGLPSGSQFPVGVNTIEFTATDVNGNSSSCSFTITVTDNEAPVAVCQNITIQLDASGNASITEADVDGGSTDQCGVASTTIDMDTFDCSHVGDNNVVLTVTDVNGNSSTCTAIVTVEDVTTPVVVCQNITVELDPVTGTVTIAGTDIDNGSTDACGIASYDLDIDTFDCSNIGDNTVVLTVTDVNGNSETCTAIVTVEDNTSPVLVCQDFTIEIGADGTATLDPSDVIATNDDACGIFTVAVDITEFTCADIGTPITVQVFSQDNNGNLATCMATVTAVDLLAPVVTCPADQTVDPGAGNLFYIVPDYFASGEATAVDNCTDPVTETTQDPAPGTALPDGIYTITLTATDAYGNVGTCDFELTVDTVLGAGEHSQDLGSITMFPNPAKHNVTIGNPKGLELESANIYDLTGRLVQSYSLKGMAGAKTLDVDNLAAATYVVIIKGKNGQTTKRLLKE
ncbi:MULTISPECIES: HYR domain-containing protein [Aequorivita]|uniref:receptor protein-tyrosine kinase n=1 Tax=Aequorivita iocasae TaxID=2803865 RepID=A0ABX7DY55_9FLAO|nr:MULTISPECIES: HYR domain-containing protein [Aequorivita]QQX78099.1 HYR domain-containing protein [Aequorivita iocasae]UCA57610.1 HYR domain-containing protein [Aequorivita sp. F7]